MLSKAAKQEIINDLSKTFKSAPSMFVVEYKGLNVGEMEILRKQLKQADAELKVVKNTLLKRASLKTDIEQINDLFIGPTAVAICEKDSPKIAKIFIKSTGDFPSLKIKGGIIEGKVVNPSEIEEISKLPSREELIAKFIGLLSAPMSNVVGTLKQMQTKVVYALNAVKDKKTEE
ncbi:MAG: 50S ribosomal protein L10 [Candidatus Dadabacteria bacterium]|nr:50S ribosomal protein L10 [Candidatus Dadabacteria bacterium]NIQ15733.1 50S ribosomal protein L10 [Candidatus Dadabacteria bacterium]